CKIPERIFLQLPRHDGSSGGHKRPHLLLLIQEFHCSFLFHESLLPLPISFRQGRFYSRKFLEFHICPKPIGSMMIPHIAVFEIALHPGRLQNMRGDTYEKDDDRRFVTGVLFCSIIQLVRD
ncbi:MAG: hypothetical protein V1791_09870, partial [Pseudomonadota bacterium]